MFKTFLVLLALQMCLLSGQEILVNNDDGAPGYTETGSWSVSSSSGYQGGTYHYTEASRQYSTATWTPNFSEGGFYEVSAIFFASQNRSTEVPYTINHGTGSSQVTISQHDESWGVMREVSLGMFYFDAGTNGSVTISNDGASGVYIADTIRFAAQDVMHLSFSGITISPQFPESGDTVNISVQVTPQNNVQNVEAHYTVHPAGTSETVNAQYAGNGIYEAQIPPQDSQSIVQFYFSATDIEDNSYFSDTLSYQVDGGGYRSIWAHAWGRSFRNQNEAEELINACRNNNINTIMIQVRKVGDAYYDSFEPRATNISGGASYDPLQYLIDLAHDTSNGQEYIHVHAWFVMQRIDTTGSNMQSSPAHVLYQHPEYVMYDDQNNTIYNGNTYFLDPGHPGSVEWNIDVILDCIDKYNIDGVNLDYIRYPGRRWGYNPTSVQRFQSAFDRNDIPAYTDSDWSDWRRLQVTNQVKKLYVKMWEKDPSVILTACTVNWGYNFTNESFHLSDAYRGVFQDWVGWLREGIIDYNALMNYTQSGHNDRYEGWTDLSLANDDIRGSIIGPGPYLHDSVEDTMYQLQYALDEGAAGVNIYAWYNEVNANTQGETRADFYNTLRTDIFDDWVDPPVSTWKTYPTKGIFHGTVSFNNDPLDYCTVVLNDNPDTRVFSDGTGWYGLLEVPAGYHTLTFSKNGYPVRTVEVQISEGGEIVRYDIDLESTSVGNWWNFF